jgi:hypothetical protein
MEYSALPLNVKRALTVFDVVPSIVSAAIKMGAKKKSTHKYVIFQKIKP